MAAPFETGTLVFPSQVKVVKFGKELRGDSLNSTVPLVTVFPVLAETCAVTVTDCPRSTIPGALSVTVKVGDVEGGGVGALSWTPTSSELPVGARLLSPE